MIQELIEFYNHRVIAARKRWEGLHELELLDLKQSGRVSGEILLMKAATRQDLEDYEAEFMAMLIVLLEDFIWEAVPKKVIIELLPAKPLVPEKPPIPPLDPSSETTLEK